MAAHSQTQICALYWHFFTPFTVCTRKGPGAAQNQYSELLYDFQGNADQKGPHNITKLPRFSFFFSSSVSPFSLALPIICSTKARHSFWMISAVKEQGEGEAREGGKERVRKGAKAAVASIQGQT